MWERLFSTPGVTFFFHWLRTCKIWNGWRCSFVVTSCARARACVCACYVNCYIVARCLLFLLFDCLLIFACRLFLLFVCLFVFFCFVSFFHYKFWNVKVVVGCCCLLNSGKRKHAQTDSAVLHATDKSFDHNNKGLFMLAPTSSVQLRAHYWLNSGKRKHRRHRQMRIKICLRNVKNCSTFMNSKNCTTR